MRKANRPVELKARQVEEVAEKLRRREDRHTLKTREREEGPEREKKHPRGMKMKEVPWKWTWMRRTAWGSSE